MILIQSRKELFEQLKQGKGGSYPKFFITKENEPVSFEVVQENFLGYARSTGGTVLDRNYDPAYDITAVSVNWESHDLMCSVSNEYIDSAY